MFRRPGRLVMAGCLVGLTASAGAVVPGAPRFETHVLTARAAAGVTKPLRAQRRIEMGKANAGIAWQRFVAMRGSKWQAAWDSATGVPSRIWGEGIPAPGAVADAAIAERIARQILADHIALLAPGAQVSDFDLAANHSDGSLRSVGFFQKAGGTRVVGGQVSFRFKADRLIAIGSEALPAVKVATPRSRMDLRVLRERAISAVSADLGLANPTVSPLGDEVVLPLVADDAVLGYRLARPIVVDGGVDGRYTAYSDVATGAVIAVVQMNAYATGTVLYHTVDRYPQKGRVDRPAPGTYVTVNGAAATTTGGGAVSWGTDAAAEVVTSVAGTLATVSNKASGNALAAATLTLGPSGSLVWDASGVVEDDAQLNAYISTLLAKAYVRANIDAAMPTIDDQITVNVNIAQNCNAYFDGKNINFFQASSSCQNTGLLQDVVFHEYGHRVHTAELIPGVGDFDGAMSEGASDFLAASMTGDPGMGRGFYYTDAALRDLDPPDHEWMWPNDIGEIHYTGQIFGGIFWDLRKALIDQLGESAGIALVNRLYLGALRRSVSIPTSLIESLVEDDDDGNLDNGTPHECAIRQAFGKHGIRTASGTVVAPGQLTVNALSIGIHVQVTGLSERCDGDEPVGAEVSWVPPYTGIPRAGTTQATPAGPNTYFAQLPLAPQESVYYKAKIKFADGSALTLADNFADPYYQLYQGETVKLYCTDFESDDPFATGWTTGTDDGSMSPFAWGVPQGGSTDPTVAYSGSKILAMNLAGAYNPKQRAWVKTPPIDVGQYSDVRLQYRRWLGSEDSHFDQAKVTANDKQAWLNLTADKGDNSSLQHIDREWRFHDVPLSGFFSGHTVTVGWEIKSDEGLELGGWQLDDVCVVANPYAICGDGVKTSTEQCDKGAANRDAPDTCRTDCRAPTCGDGIIDSEEECDAGPDGSPVCSKQCTIVGPADSGCCSTGGSGPGAFALAGLVGLVLRRRRRR